MYKSILKSTKEKINNLVSVGANKFVNSRVYKLYSLKPYSVEVKNYRTGEQETFTISPEKPEMGFIDQVWSNLDKAKRIQLCFWLTQKICKENGLEPIDYKQAFSKNDKTALACFNTDSTVFFSPDNVQQESGLVYLAAIYHEMKHYYDFSILNNLPASKNCIFSKNLDQIISGKKDETYTSVSHHIIDVLKNYSPVIQNLVRLHSQEAKDLSYLMYYRSPMENSAFKVSIEQLTNFCNSKSLLSYLNEKDAKSYQRFSSGTNERIEYENFKMPFPELENAVRTLCFDRANKPKNTHLFRYDVDIANKELQIVLDFWCVREHNKSIKFSKFRDKMLEIMANKDLVEL
jgi:hypothetical protein